MYILIIIFLDLKVLFDRRVFSEYDSLDAKVQDKFDFLFRAIAFEKEMPKGKVRMLNKDLNEFRIKYDGNIYRAIFSLVKPDVIILVVFHKKTQKTPLKYIKTALKRLNYYRN